MSVAKPDGHSSGHSAYLAAAAGGILFGAAACWTLYGVACWLSLAILAAALFRYPKRGIALSAAWALPAFGMALVWMWRFGSAPWIVLTLWHVLFVIPVGAGARLVLPEHRLITNAAGLAALFALGEWTRGIGELGVGMVTAAGTVARNLPAVQWASVLGSAGLTFWLTFSAFLAGAALASGRKNSGAFLGAVAIAAAMPAGGAALLKVPLGISGQVNAAALQGVTQDGWEELADEQKAMEIYLDLTRRAAGRGAEMVVWPETSLPGQPFSDGDLMADMLLAFSEVGIPGLVGTIDVSRSGVHTRVTNIVLGFKPNGRLSGMYEKERLVPFGEIVPGRRFLPSLERWGLKGLDYTRGVPLRPIQIDGFGAGVLICSETMFSGFALERVREGADMLAVVSNDSWFRRGPGTEQLARLSILRAVESGRSVVRSAETGYSMMIDPKGRVLAVSELYDRSVIIAQLPLCKGQTIFYWLHPIVPAVLAAIAATHLLTGRRRSTRSRGDHGAS